jgi:Flp pilus assembly pilin Flp
MRLIKKIQSKSGQNFIEYALVVAVIAAAMMAMSTYVFRSVQATQQVIQKGFRAN